MLDLGHCDARIALMYVKAKNMDNNPHRVAPRKSKLKTILEFPAQQNLEDLFHFLETQTLQLAIVS